MEFLSRYFRSSRVESTNREISSSRLSLQVLEARDVPSASDLGEAANFNAFFFDDMDAFTSDAEGRVAVGDHGKFYAYGIGDKLINSNGIRDDLITGGDLDYTYGQVFNGNIVHGGVGTLDSVGTPNGDVRQESGVLDFGAIKTELSTKSTAWGSEAPNGTTRIRYTNLNLTGTNSQLNIFGVAPHQLANSKSIYITAPPSSTVLINVPGTDINIHDLGFHVRGVDSSKILWNFYEATHVDFSGIGFQGSMLAPLAHFDFNNGSFWGTAIADSMTGNGQFNLSPSKIQIVIPELSSISGMVFLDEDKNNLLDPNEQGFNDIEVRITGKDSLGRNINRSYVSQNGGLFDQTGLWPGTYKLSLELPAKYAASDELGIPGTINAVTVGVGVINAITTITIGEGEHGIDYLLPIIEPNH